MLRTCRRCLIYLWVAPSSFVGLLVGGLGLVSRGRVQIQRGVMEFHGGAVTWLLNRLPISPRAMTLGHTILGCSVADLDATRDHEHVHVRQYERWGPAFIPAYLLCSFALWIRGRDPYRENPFEIEAFDLYP